MPYVLYGLVGLHASSLLLTASLLVWSYCELRAPWWHLLSSLWPDGIVQLVSAGLQRHRAATRGAALEELSPFASVSAHISTTCMAVPFCHLKIFVFCWCWMGMSGLSWFNVHGYFLTWGRTRLKQRKPKKQLNMIISLLGKAWATIPRVTRKRGHCRYTAIYSKNGRRVEVSEV